jgi:hypothetical protein
MSGAPPVTWGTRLGGNFIPNPRGVKGRGRHGAIRPPGPPFAKSREGHPLCGCASGKLGHPPGPLKRKIAQEYAYSNPPRSPNPRQSGHRKRGRKGQCGRLECVRCHRQSHELGLMRELPKPLPEGIYRMPSVYGFVKLMRSLEPCIVAVCKLRYRTCLLYVGLCEGALAGHLEPNIHAHADTRDIRNVV